MEKVSLTTEWENLYKQLEGKKTDMGVSLQEELRKYQKAILTVALLPSYLKSEIQDYGLKLPNRDKINKIIDTVGKLEGLLLAEFK